jgi:hypothetical protein
MFVRVLSYPTWIRTKTSRTRICGTTVILSGSRNAKLKNRTRKKTETFASALLPDLDSNQDKQYQKLSYYHYTIGHPAIPFLVWERKNMGGGTTTQIFKSSILKKLEINTKTG